MEFGKIIKEARLAKGLTQEQLGKIIGVQKAAIAKYEAGIVINIKRSKLQALAKALDLKGSDLIEADPVQTASFHAKVLSDHAVMEMLKEYYKLDEAQKEAVRNLIRSLAKQFSDQSKNIKNLADAQPIQDNSDH